MNNILKYSLATLLGLGSVNIASAALITGGFDGTSTTPLDVGDIDTFLGHIDKTTSAWTDNYGSGNSTTSEEAWVNDFLLSTGITTTYIIKDEGPDIDGDGVPYVSTDSTGVYAFAFDPAPGGDYFIVKNSTYIALFENLASLDYGVFDISDLPTGMNIPSSSFTISHVGSLNDTTPPIIGGGGGAIPEPTSIFLIGTGLLGAFGASRKKS